MQCFHLKGIAKLQRNRLTTTQGSSTARSFLPGMCTWLVSYIFGCAQRRASGPGIVIWISFARMGKQIGMPFNCVLLEFTMFFLFFFGSVCNHYQKKTRSGRLFPTQRRLFATQRRLHPTNFFDALFPTGAGGYSS